MEPLSSFNNEANWSGQISDKPQTYQLGVTEIVDEILKLVRMFVIYRDVYADTSTKSILVPLCLPVQDVERLRLKFLAHSKRGYTDSDSQQLERLATEVLPVLLQDPVLRTPSKQALVEHVRAFCDQSAFCDRFQNPNVHEYIMSREEKERPKLFKYFLTGEDEGVAPRPSARTATKTATLSTQHR